MAITNIHGGYAVTLDATTIGGITQHSAPTNTETTAEATSNNVRNTFVAMSAQNPTFSFTTISCAAALAAAGAIGTSIDGMAAGLIFYAQKHVQGGTRAGTLAHRKFVINAGVLYPTTLTADHQGDATVAYEAMINYDGSNDPIVVTESQTLPAATDAERFAIGGMTIGAVALPQIRSLSINFGISATAEGTDSDVWPTFAGINTIAPTITLNGIDSEWFKAANIPLVGKAATQANSTLYLRKRALAGQYVADITAEHIKINTAGFVAIDEILNAPQNGPGETSLQLTTYYDGSNEALTINTASAIT